MTKKQRLIRVLFGLTLLFPLVLQSLHGLVHYEEQLSQEICYHNHLNKSDITHQHKLLELCDVCSFTFNTFIPSDFFSFQFTSFHYFIEKQCNPTDKIAFFSGSLFSHRGPPHRL